MRRVDIAELVALAALWGGSFLFMRICAAEFGPALLVFLRVGGASLLLMPLALAQGNGAALRRHWRAIAVVGALNTALPFLFFAISALVLNAGLSAIFNATAPLWGSLIAWLWLGDRPSQSRTLGLVIGFLGVAGLGLHSASFKAGAQGLSPALGIAACLAATFCYGYAASYTKKHLTGVAPMALAAGSQFAAALLTALPALWLHPATLPGAGPWAAVAGLAFGCTALAYVMYFRLIAHAGPTNAISVTFLVPLFGVLWGALFLGEKLSGATLAGCAVILLGTALATGLIGPRPAPAAAAS
ncbi:MAG: DMT family transporter [Burkholderiales bacterium]|nr:DMT family transporter [Burkholderiales bacterium]MDE2456446.1 DMT family transporter [Burkholderiales bacterium]